MIIKLVRLVSNDKGAFGVLVHNGYAFAVTIEHTYISPSSPNAHLAKIQVGDHLCTPRMYFKGGYMTWQVQTPGHTDVLLHKANFFKDVDGCVGVGEKFNEFGEHFGDNPGIAESAGGFAELMKITTGLQSFTLRVIDVVDIVGA